MFKLWYLSYRNPVRGLSKSLDIDKLVVKSNEKQNHLYLFQRSNEYTSNDDSTFHTEFDIFHFLNYFVSSILNEKVDIHTK